MSMRFTRRYMSCFPSRRNWCSTLVLLVILCTFLLSWILYNCLSLLLETGHVRNFLFINAFKTQVREEILNLNSADEIVFQGEESVAPLRDVTESEVTESEIVQIDISVKASLKTYLLNGKTKRKKIDPTLLNSNYTFGKMNTTGRYLFIFGHYEQLGKTTINFFQASVLARKMKRDVVIPLVRNSRYCGLPSGWTGSTRRTSRQFFALDNYFSMNSLEDLFLEERFAKISSQSEHEKECISGASKSVVIYFLYSGQKEDDKRYLNLKEDEYISLQTKLEKNNGWTDCHFIDNRLSSQERMKKTNFSAALCIDPEIIHDAELFENLVSRYKCVSILLWRGIGYQRTHFNVTLPNSHDTYLSRLSASHFVSQEVNTFAKKHFHGNSYLGIHIRSERQLVWYGIEKFEKCMSLVKQVLDILVSKKNIKHIFIASDLETHGSDVIPSAVNETILTRAKNILKSFIINSHLVTYKPDKSRGWIFNDAGFVALTQMEILMRSKHMITLGAGTFQSWIIAKFKKYRKELKTSWSLTRVCSAEIKNYNQVKNVPQN